MPLRGPEDIARRGLHDFRVLSRLIQPRAGYREDHHKPVPAALAKYAGTTDQESREDQ